MLADCGGIKIFLNNEKVSLTCCERTINEAQWEILINRFGQVRKDSEKKYVCYKCSTLCAERSKWSHQKDALNSARVKLDFSCQQKERESDLQKQEIKKLEMIFNSQNESILNLKNRLGVLKKTKEELSQTNSQLQECYLDVSGQLTQIKFFLENLKKEASIEKKNYENCCRDLDDRIKALVIEAQNLQNQHEINIVNKKNNFTEKLKTEETLIETVQIKLLKFNQKEDSLENLDSSEEE